MTAKAVTKAFPFSTKFVGQSCTYLLYLSPTSPWLSRSEKFCVAKYFGRNLCLSSSKFRTLERCPGLALMMKLIPLGKRLCFLPSSSSSPFFFGNFQKWEHAFLYSARFVSSNLEKKAKPSYPLSCPVEHQNLGMSPF